MELRIKPLGLFALALLLLGISLGVTRLLNRGVASAENAPRSGSNGVRGGGEVLLVTSKTKKDWLQTEIEKFNAKNQGRLTVKVEFLETRDALQEILNGKVKPALWAPSSPIWTSRLGEAWSVGHGGKKLLSVSDPATFRIYLRTPMVILTTKEKAPALRAILGGSDPWNGLRGLNTGSRSVPWGTFKYTYADPLNANSGFLTLGMILADYGQRTQPSVDLKIVAESDGFKSFVRDLNTKLVYDEPSRKGSSDLFKAFLADPNRYDFITTYESNAIGAAEKNPELAVIYPMPTAVAEQSVVLLSGGDWLTPEQKAGGQEFLRFLAEADSLKDGVKSRFRPANPSGEANLTGAINALKGQGFQQTYSGVELPPYEAINDAAYNWRKQVQPTAPWVRS